MRQTVYTQPIARPPEKIWAFLSDLRNDSAWRREITSVELMDGNPGEAGARYLETVTWEGLTGHAVLTISEASPASRLVVLSDGAGYVSRSVWTFEKQQYGTLLTLAFSLDITGVAHLTEPLMWSVVTKWLARDLPLLEGHLSAA